MIQAKEELQTYSINENKNPQPTPPSNNLDFVYRQGLLKRS